jgi:26S proteasome regulatory subunit N6
LNDRLIRSKFKELTNILEEENLLKFLKPYSKVQIRHISNLIKLPIDYVTKKLSCMIIEKKLNGIIDQNKGAIIINNSELDHEITELGITTFKNLESVIEKLITKSLIN